LAKNRIKGGAILETLWFILLAYLFVGYTILDGFDLGVGILFPFVTGNDDERRLAINAIGPIWDGNEVWLVAAGGTLFFAFPKAYASALGGLYLAIMLLLWMLILRELAIELRGQINNPLWRSFWDGVFFLSSLALALLLGTALGNLLRGFPLDAQGRFFLPLWTNWLPGVPTGILDWYTLLIGLTAIVVLSLHGASFLVWKTPGEMQQRARLIASRLVWASGALALLSLLATPLAQPQIASRFLGHPLGFAFPLLALAAWILLVRAIKRGQSALILFGLSKSFIVALLGTAFFGLFPNLLIALGDQTNSLTVFNAATTPYGLRVGLAWFIPGLLLILAYTGFMYRSFWGKATLADEGY
jgi:cytochrome d ubiquinol oxidase subunit II